MWKTVDLGNLELTVENVRSLVEKSLPDTLRTKELPKCPKPTYPEAPERYLEARARAFRTISNCTVLLHAPDLFEAALAVMPFDEGEEADFYRMTIARDVPIRSRDQWGFIVSGPYSQDVIIYHAKHSKEPEPMSELEILRAANAQLKERLAEYEAKDQKHREASREYMRKRREKDKP